MHQKSAGFGAENPQGNRQDATPEPDLVYDFSSLSPGTVDISDLVECPDDDGTDREGSENPGLESEREPSPEEAEEPCWKLGDDSLGMVECSADMVLGK